MTQHLAKRGISPLQAWRRRWWRRDEAAIAAFAGLRPIVVITGASAGIGLAFARSFGRSGHDVLMIARDAAALTAAADDVKRAGSAGRIETLALDVTDADAATRLDGTMSGLGGYADILVNNAGIGRAGDFVSQSQSDLDDVLSLNIVALTRLCRHVLPGQLVRGAGGIINVASIGGVVPGPHQAAYYASKAYVLSLSEALAAETSGHGVRVTAVLPGPVETAFHAKMGAERALYRMILPSLSPATIALSGRIAFALGLRISVPGIVNSVFYLALRFLPHRILVPLVGLLLRPPAK